jgi:hypothetical protein
MTRFRDENVGGNGRLQAVEMTIADDPFARQSEVDEASSALRREAEARHGGARQRGAGSTKGRAGTRATRYKRYKK